MPAPAPAGPYASSLSAFKGTNPLGGWALYIADDELGDVGSMSGWCLNFLPSITAGEVPNLRFADKTTLVWDAGANATSYNVYRGDQSVVASLADQTSDACRRGTALTQQLTAVSEVPAVGTYEWYLVVGANAQGEGPPGFLQLGAQQIARIVNSTGTCP